MAKLTRVTLRGGNDDWSNAYVDLEEVIAIKRETYDALGKDYYEYFVLYLRSGEKINIDEKSFEVCFKHHQTKMPDLKWDTIDDGVLEEMFGKQPHQNITLTPRL